MERLKAFSGAAFSHSTKEVHDGTIDASWAGCNDERMSGFLRFWRKRSGAQPDVAGWPSAILLLSAAGGPRFGAVRSGRFELSLEGELARECWLAMPSAFPSLKLDVFSFLPQEFHAILHDTSRNGQIEHSVAWFMYQSEEQIRTLRGQGIRRVW